MIDNITIISNYQSMQFNEPKFDFNNESFPHFTPYLNTLDINKIINSKTVFISPDYTTEGIKSKEESAFLDKTTNVSLLLESQSNKGSSNSSLSSHHPITSLSNFPLSTNSCVNIKGAELEVILNNDIIYTLTHN